MTLPKAIERAKSALEERTSRLEDRLDTQPEIITPLRKKMILEKIARDTEALADLREWKPEEKE